MKATRLKWRLCSMHSCAIGEGGEVDQTKGGNNTLYYSTTTQFPGVDIRIHWERNTPNVKTIELRCLEKPVHKICSEWDTELAKHMAQALFEYYLAEVLPVKMLKGGGFKIHKFTPSEIDLKEMSNGEIREIFKAKGIFCISVKRVGKSAKNPGKYVVSIDGYGDIIDEWDHIDCDDKKSVPKAVNKLLNKYLENFFFE